MKPDPSPAPQQRLAELREFLLDRIDGSEETRAWDSKLTRFIEAIDALPSEIAPTSAPVEVGAQADAKRYAWIREFVAAHLREYIVRGWRGGMGAYDPDTPPDLIHEWKERKREELDALIDEIRSL